MNTINQTRQILMNELGLTRESIRAEMENIIELTIVKHIGKIISSDNVKKIVEKNTKELDKSIKAIVVSEAKKQVSEFIKDNLKIGT